MTEEDEVEMAAAILARIIAGVAPSYNEHVVFSLIRDFIDDGRFGLEGTDEIIAAIKAQLPDPKTDTVH